MRQVFLNINDGSSFCTEVPRPKLAANEVLVKTVYSLISPGTERMLLEFGKGSWISRAKQQPDKFRDAISKVKADGLLPTYKAIFNQLSKPLPVGYSNLGIVIETGESVHHIKAGDRVISNGPHGEIAAVSASLCVPIPEGVASEEAVFAILGAIGLQGIRLIKPELGETFVVIGLGLVGLITSQIIRANGCHCIGFDNDIKRVNIARNEGLDAYLLDDSLNPLDTVTNLTNGQGSDGVLICAATSSNQPIEIAAKMCRKRGRVVLVGVVGLNINRRDFFDKEITFQVSCSYGPGRYDDAFEKRGLDYPIGYVRWTEERNIFAIIDLLKQERIRFRSYITKRVRFDDLALQYSELLENNENLGILIEYATKATIDLPFKIEVNKQTCNSTVKLPTRISFIGGGNHTRSTLLPALTKRKVSLQGICSRGGTSGSLLAHKFPFRFSTTVTEDILSDSETNTVFISTRHNLHAELTQRAIIAGKHVFIEKPLALSMRELNLISGAMKNHPNQVVMVGYNRSYAPLTTILKGKLAQRTAPMVTSILVNAGQIPSTNWNNDSQEGGGRIIGEACHFIDLAITLTGSKVKSIYCCPVALTGDKSPNNGLISMSFHDGSAASIQYLCNGSRAFPKESITVFSSGKVYEIKNFISSRGFSVGNQLNMFRTQDKGHQKCIETFLDIIEGKTNSKLAAQDIIESAACSIAAVDSFNSGHPIIIEEFMSQLSP